jgi:hypothetical protein
MNAAKSPLAKSSRDKKSPFPPSEATNPSSVNNGTLILQAENTQTRNSSVKYNSSNSVNATRLLRSEIAILKSILKIILERVCWSVSPSLYAGFLSPASTRWRATIATGSRKRLAAFCRSSPSGSAGLTQDRPYSFLFVFIYIIKAMISLQSGDLLLRAWLKTSFEIVSVYSYYFEVRAF